MYIVDTNVFLRFIVGDLPDQQDQCRRFFALSENNKIKICTSVVITNEVYFALSKFYQFDKKSVLDIMMLIYQVNNPIECNDIKTDKALELFESHAVKFVDCQIASIPKVFSNEWTIVTYDADFKKLPVKALTPGEVLKLH